MKKTFLILLLLTCLFFNKSQAQDNTAAIVGSVASAAAIAGAIISSVDNMKERAELRATQFILSEHPELNYFSLKTLDFDGKKLKDLSNTSVISYKIQEFIPADNPKLSGRKAVLFGFTSYGWVSDHGIDFSRVHWFLIDRVEWMNMMVAYAKVSSTEKNDSKLKQIVSNGLIVNRGIKVKGKLEIPFFKLEGDMYLVTDYSPEMKLVYNEKHLGIFLKKTSNLVQISRDDLIKTHEYLFD